MTSSSSSFSNILVAPIRHPYKDRRDTGQQRSASPIVSSLPICVPPASAECSSRSSETPEDAVRSSSGFKNFASSGRGDITARTLLKQQEVLAKRRLSFSFDGRRARRRLLEGRGKSSLSRERSVRESWELYLSTVEEDFFASEEAILEGEVQAGKGGVLYASLKVDETNNEDLKRVYELSWRAKHDAGSPIGSYQMFKTAVGQYTRLFVALRGETSEFVYSLHEPGRLFRMSADIEIARAFINHFSGAGRASTTKMKSVHLKNLVDHAVAYFFEIDENAIKGRALAVSKYLGTTRNAQKKLAAREHRQRKAEKERLERGDFLTPEDFARLSEKAVGALEGIVSSFRQEASDSGWSAASRLLARSKELKRKWCVNLIASMILNGGGQRPQVFCQLQLPHSDREMEEMKKMAKEEGYFQLRTVLEKTTRSSDLPSAVFPKRMLRYVRFHCKNVRPAIISNSGIAEDGVLEKTLLVHSEKGQPLESWQVTRALRSFLQRHDKELTNVTSMTIRGSFATMMLGLYRSGKVLKNKTEEQFLELLAMQMNTSVEQLTRAYVSFGERDFRESARELALAMDQTSGGNCLEGADESGGACDWARRVWG